MILFLSSNEWKTIMSQQFSPSQLRAARALLDWSRAELATQTGVSEPTIHRLENGVGEPGINTQTKIRRFFESHGIEFLDSDGVRKRPEGVEIFQGDEDFRKLYDLIYAQASYYGGTICVSGVDETLFERHQRSFYPMHKDRMARLAKERKDFKMMILIREGDTFFMASSYATYRWQNEEDFSTTSFYVFGSYLALISFHAAVSPKVILIHSREFADAYRKQFMGDWKRAKEPVKRKN
jgi:transcriptional regulator with XRE-family HTH domain